MDSLEQQVTDKLQSAYLSVWGDRPQGTGTTPDPDEVREYERILRQEMGECIQLLAREIDRLRAQAS